MATARQPLPLPLCFVSNVQLCDLHQTGSNSNSSSNNSNRQTGINVLQFSLEKKAWVGFSWCAMVLWPLRPEQKQKQKEAPAKEEPSKAHTDLELELGLDIRTMDAHKQQHFAELREGRFT
ncbi:hypothetical protein ACLKA7_000623 [Drosophila subpalustris]